MEIYILILFTDFGVTTIELPSKNICEAAVATIEAEATHDEANAMCIFAGMSDW